MTKVIILGGGVAGLSAAHELIERGFSVEVYEKNPRYLGGKARSVDYSGDPNNPYSNPLPGEHGFRFFPGFYKHVIDTMKRIPFQDVNGKQLSVADNLTATSRIMVARYNKPPIVTTASFPKSQSDLRLIIKDMHGVDSGLTEEEMHFFADRVWQLITSCTNRRNNDYERLGWWQYLDADRFGSGTSEPSPYQSLLVQGLTRTLVAARAETASTKTGGNIFLQLLFTMFDPTINTDRVLNGPTNDKWLIPWTKYLQEKGVVIHQGVSVTNLQLNKEQQISSVSITDANGNTRDLQADYYILATPIEQAAPLINEDMLKADRTLQYVKNLAPSVSWMNGIQYYLTEDVQINKGHVIYSDSDWAVTSISQVQFWKDYAIEKHGNGKVKGVLSVDISDWFTRGRFTTKLPADACTREQVAREVWEQLKHSLNVDGQIVLKDEMLVDWYLDRDITENASVNDATTNLLGNREPLLVNTVNSWDLRPEAHCGIQNLFFASDYVRTHTDLATMEGANEAARRAVNCLLDQSNYSGSRCKIWPLHEPLLFIPLRWYDQYRWRNGLPWTISIPFWLKIMMVPWVGLCLAGSFLKTIWYRLTKTNSQQ